MDELYVTVAKGSPSDVHNQEIPKGDITASSGLVKQVSFSQLQGTFQDLLFYMLDSNGDELNNQYTPEETEYANNLSELLEQAESAYLRSPKTGQQQYQLTDLVEQFATNLVESKSTIKDGKSVPYKSIDLIIETVHRGGYKP